MTMSLHIMEPFRLARFSQMELISLRDSRRGNSRHKFIKNTSFGRFQTIWSCPWSYLGHLASIGWVGVESYDFHFFGPKMSKLALGSLKNESGAWDLPQDASIYRWPHLFIDGPASIYRCIGIYL